MRKRVHTLTVGMLLASTVGLIEFIVPETTAVALTVVAAEEVHDGTDYEVRLSLLNGDLVLTENTEDDRFVSFAGGVAVWQRLTTNGWEIVVWTVDAGLSTITNDASDDTLPQTDGRYVVWQRLQDDRSSIMLYDVQNPVASFRQISEADVTSQAPNVADGRVVWQAWVGSNWEIMSWNESEGLVRMTMNTTADIEPDVSEQHIVWEGVDPQGADRDIFAADVLSQELLILTDNELPDGMPEFREDGKVSWFLNADTQTVVRVTTDVASEFLWAQEGGEEVGVAEVAEVTEETNVTEEVEAAQVEEVIVDEEVELTEDSDAVVESQSPEASEDGIEEVAVEGEEIIDETEVTEETNGTEEMDVIPEESNQGL